MVIRNNLKIFGSCLALGFVASACAALNPNTEGQLAAAMDAKMTEFKVCYEGALDRDRDTKGAVQLKLKVDAESGQVTSSSIEDTNIVDNEMNQCVANVASDIALPEPPGVAVEGYYDVNFDFE